MQEASLGRVITENHRRLDSMFEELLAMLREGDGAATASAAFATFRAAIESHADREDQLYCPALDTLRPAHRTVVDGLIADHRDFRIRLAKIDALLDARDLVQAESTLEAFATDFAAHEKIEELLAQDIDSIYGV